MLTRFRVNNFKSLLNFEFRPVGMNLVIGPNNAGKTNLCSALRFLGLTSQQTLDGAILSTLGERWNLTNLHVPNSAAIEFEAECRLAYGDEVLTFNYQLCLQARRGEIGEVQSLTVLQEVLKASGGRFAHTTLVENRGGQVRMLHEEGFVQKRPDSPYYAGARVPAESSMLSQLYELEDNPRAILFRRFLRSWAYYHLSPDHLRAPDVVRHDASLSSNGANLSRVLFALHNEKPRVEKKLIDITKLLEPRLDLFSFSSPDPEHVHLFVEDKAEHKLSARSISDGTLRFMGMIYIILMAEQEARAQGFSPLVIIEEPENGLYVGHLKPLIELTDESGKRGQFIFTSHSPYFIDLFDKTLEGIHILKPGHPSSVSMQPDPDKVRQMLNDMPLGEMHFREMLG